MDALQYGVDSQHNLQVRNINGVNLNPRRRKHRKSRRGHRYMEYMDNPNMGGYLGHHNYMEMENPIDLGDQLINGSPVTQDVSPVDLGVGALSFLLNNWVVRQIGLTGTTGLIVSGIFPFVSGAAASMLHSRFGTAVFFGGEMDFTLKAIAKIPGLNMLGGLHEQGNGMWVLASLPQVNFSVPNLGSLLPHQQAALPAGGAAGAAVPAAGGAAAGGGAAHNWNLRYRNPMGGGETVFREY